MVALTGPDVLSSSSAGAGADSGATAKAKGTRFMGRRKKKAGTATASKAATMNDGGGGASTNIADLNFATQSNINMPTSTTQPLHAAAQSSGPPPLKDISFTGNSNATMQSAGGYNSRHRAQQQQQQQPPPLMNTQNNHLSPISAANNGTLNTNLRDGSNKQQYQQLSSSTNNNLPLDARIGSNMSAISAASSTNNNNYNMKHNQSQNNINASAMTFSSAITKAHANHISMTTTNPGSLGGGNRSMKNKSTANITTLQQPIQNNGSQPLARSGWSITSNASSAMNSEHYIQSLDSKKSFPMLPNSPGRVVDGDNVSNTRGRIRTTSAGAAMSMDERIKHALSRQFGRSYPPHAAFQPKWSVKVGRPKFNEVEGRYKYKIHITKHRSSSIHTNNDIIEVDDDEEHSESAADAASDTYSQLTFASTSASRSLQDFVWLEQALRAEYHGALIVPMLSLSLYFGELSLENNDSAVGEEDEESLASRSLATDATSKETAMGNNKQKQQALISSGGNVVPQSFRYLDEKMEHNGVVNETILSNWLSDIINGLRGNGEVILNNCAGVVESEAMETFLYRHSENKGSRDNGGLAGRERASNLGSPFNSILSMAGLNTENKCQDKSFFENFMENPFECIGMETVCVGGDKKNRNKGQQQQQGTNGKISMGSMMCSSGATGVPGIGHCNSYLSQSEAEVDLAWLQSSSRIATHSELLEAEKDLIASYLKSSSLAMIKVQSLTNDEAHVGQCWKRFAISLSNLFMVEKDLEQAHIGDQIKSNKKKQPFRKLRKSVVDDALRTLARRKVERSNTSLAILGAMLNAYCADLNSIVPAFREYSEAINHLHPLDKVHSKLGTIRTGADEWQTPYEHLKTLTWGVSKHFTGGGTVMSAESDPTVDDDSCTLGSLSTAQTKVLQRRLLANEKLLKFSITLLCRASPLRNARMAWWYLKTEAKQALNVHTAAANLRQKLSIDPDTAAAMKDRKYEEDEKKDNDAELKLVKRILDLGSADPDDDSSMFEKNESRQDAIRICTEQVGRWNAKTALALMAAAGVGDAEVKIDETSRELRHVRKYAISLRENVARCLEAAEALASSYVLNNEGAVQISRSRREFWAAISTVFSGKIIADEPNGPEVGTLSMRVLSSAGIDTSDRGGWLGHNPNQNQPVSLIISLNVDFWLYSHYTITHHHSLFLSGAFRTSNVGTVARLRDNILKSATTKQISSYLAL